MYIEQFTHELKRRGVIRAAGWYAIVSWVAMLVISVTVPILTGGTTIVRPMYAAQIAINPDWKDLRDDPRFKAIIAKHRPKD